MERIEIQNLKCSGCVDTVHSGLSKINGIENLNVDLKSSTISFTKVNKELDNQVKSKLAEMGYPALG